MSEWVSRVSEGVLDKAGPTRGEELKPNECVRVVKKWKFVYQMNFSRWKNRSLTREAKENQQHQQQGRQIDEGIRAVKDVFGEEGVEK